jgi:hypothetical protein
MANNKEEAGKGTPRPGDMPAARRPYATLDLTASEVDSGGKGKPQSTPPGAAATAAGEAAAAARSGSGPSAPQPKAGGAAPGASAAGSDAAKSEGPAPRLIAGVPAMPLLTHLAAGAAGAFVVLILSQSVETMRSADVPALGDLTRRLADVENALGTRPGVGLRARIEDVARSAGALGEAQAKLARETKALDTKIASAPAVPPEIAGRLAKLEETLAAASTADPAALSPQVAGLAGKIADIEKVARQAGEANAARATRYDGELAALRTEAGRLAQRLDTLKGEVEERLKGVAKASDFAPLAAKLGALEKDAQTFAKGEAERAASSTQMLLALELSALKRAIERGEGYADELARAKKLAGATVNLAPLERSMGAGVPTPQELSASFRKVANAMLDAESETSDASLLDRFMAGARSIVRVRKVGHPGDDTSLEAVIGRMETALKEGRLGDVLTQAKKLPPKAALVGEDWIKKVEARYAVEQAIANVEASLKASLSGPSGGAPEARK